MSTSPSPHRATICLSFDFDAISLWIGAFGPPTPSTISRGEFGAVGARRLLTLLERAAVPATFFIPGHTAETYPDLVRAIATVGHEIGHHGDRHESPLLLGTRDREREVLQRGLDSLDRVAGVRPVGYRSPAWDNSPHTVELLLEHGFRYESSLMADDFTPYWCRVGDELPPDGPFRPGTPVDLVEMPVSWVLDDFPHFEYVSLGGPVRPGLAAPSKVEEIWRAEFEFMVREIPDGVFTLTMHPQVIGRGHRLLMLERLIAYFQSHPAVRFTTLAHAADAFRDRDRTRLPAP